MKISILSCLTALLMLAPPTQGGLVSALVKAANKAGSKTAKSLPHSETRTLETLRKVPVGRNPNPGSSAAPSHQNGGVPYVLRVCVKCAGRGVINHEHHEETCDCCNGSGRRYVEVSK